MATPIHPTLTRPTLEDLQRLEGQRVRATFANDHQDADPQVIVVVRAYAYFPGGEVEEVLEYRRAYGASHLLFVSLVEDVATVRPL